MCLWPVTPKGRPIQRYPEKIAGGRAGVNKGAHGAVIQKYYEQVVECAVETRNRLTQPRDK